MVNKVIFQNYINIEVELFKIIINKAKTIRCCLKFRFSWLGLQMNYYAIQIV